MDDNTIKAKIKELEAEIDVLEADPNFPNGQNKGDYRLSERKCNLDQEVRDLIRELKPKPSPSTISSKDLIAKMTGMMDKFTDVPVTKQQSLFPKADKHILTTQEARVKGLRDVDLSQNASFVPTLLTNARFFTPGSHGRRAFFRKWRPVPVWGFPEVQCWNRIYQLNQWDFTVLLGLLHFAQQSPNFDSCFTGGEFLRFIKRPVSGGYRQYLRECIDRLQAAQVCVSIKGETDGKKAVYRMSGPLIGKSLEDESDKRFAISLGKEIHDLLGISHWSFMNMEQRSALGKNQFALEWHALLSSYTGPKFWIKKADLMKVWGANYVDPKIFIKAFRQKVLKPLKDIGFVTKVEEKPTAVGIYYNKRKKIK